MAPPAAPTRDDTPYGGLPVTDDTPVGIVRPIARDAVPSLESASSSSASPRRTSRPGRRRVWWRLLLLAVVAVVAYFGVTFFQVWSTGRSDQVRPVDAIVVMGAAQYDGTPSPQLAARLDHAADLYALGLAPLVVVTGGKQPDDRFTEAEASAHYLVDRGVPADAIVLENDGRTTFESLHGVAGILDARGLDSVLIVTDPFHSLRSRLIAEDAGLDAYVSPTPSSVVTGGNELRRELVEAAGIGLGRVVGFDRI